MILKEIFIGWIGIMINYLCLTYNYDIAWSSALRQFLWRTYSSQLVKSIALSSLSSLIVKLAIISRDTEKKNTPYLDELLKLTNKPLTITIKRSTYLNFLHNISHHFSVNSMLLKPGVQKYYKPKLFFDLIISEKNVP